MLDQIHLTFSDREETPLFFSEAGSRAYGIHNSKSDYDVRGIYLPSKVQYFDFKPHQDHIEIDDGIRDFSFFTLDKAFQLLANSNPSILEWIRSSIVYLNVLPDWEEFKDSVLKQIEFKALFHHYRSHAKSHFKLMESGRKMDHKTLFYCIRGLMSAQVASRLEIPRLMASELFEQYGHENEMVKLAERCIRMKREFREKENVSEEDQLSILGLLGGESERLELLEPASLNRKKALVQILSGYSYRIKESIYR